MINIAGVNMTKEIAQRLSDFDIDALDLYEGMEFERNEIHGKEFSLQIIINTVEGDYTQLSDELSEIAELQDRTNAKLIAAAPILYDAAYKALQAIYAMPKSKQGFYQYLIDELLNAIQKADGTII